MCIRDRQNLGLDSGGDRRSSVYVALMLPDLYRLSHSSANSPLKIHWPRGCSPHFTLGTIPLAGERVLDHVWYLVANDLRLWEQGQIDRGMLTATGKMEVFFQHARRGENIGEYYVLEVMPWCQLGMLFKQLQNTLAQLFVNTWSQYTGCLLYTSPSPRDGLLSRMPSSA